MGRAWAGGESTAHSDHASLVAADATNAQVSGTEVGGRSTDMSATPQVASAPARASALARSARQQVAETVSYPDERARRGVWSCVRETGTVSQVDSDETIRSFAKTHLALIASAALVAFSGLRVYFFSGFDLPRALTILSVANRTSILVSTFLYLLTAISPSLLVFNRTRAWLLAGNASRASVGLQLRTAVIWIPLGMMIFALATPLLAAAVVLGSVLGTILLRRWATKNRKARDAAQNEQRPAEIVGFPKWVGEIPWLLATVVGLGVAFSLLTPWQAKESLSVASADNSIVGYVIGEQAGQLLVVGEKKQLTWVSVDEITARGLCAATDLPWYSSRLTSLLSDTGPKCD